MYRVQLQNFEGPLDLLLFFIRRDELNIYDIPISYITKQFLDYIGFLEELDLSVASEFIYMASTLMAIKARMLLPQPEHNDVEADEEDPRYELVQALLEYKRFKEAAQELSVHEKKARYSYTRGYFRPDHVEPEQKGEALRDVSIIDIMTAFKKVLERSTETHYHDVRRHETDFVRQTKYVTDVLRKKGKVSFQELCADLKTRIYVVITFLAVLELIKENQIKLYVSNDLTDFFLELYSPEELYSYA